MIYDVTNINNHFVLEKSEKPSSKRRINFLDDKLVHLKKIRLDENSVKPINNSCKNEIVSGWEKRRPAIVKIYNDDLSSTMCIIINGSNYPIKPLGKGKNHQVYEFIESGYIKFGNTTVSTNDIVLKIIGPWIQPGKDRHRNMHLNTMQGYTYLIEQGISVTKVYADPLTFQDIENQANGGFWVTEKCDRIIDGEGWSQGQQFCDLSEEDQKLLLWVKEKLEYSVQNDVETIGSFRRDNVMRDKAGNFKITDFSFPPMFDILGCRFARLSEYVCDWANGNKNIFNFLVNNFPEANKGCITKNFENSVCKVL